MVPIVAQAGKETDGRGMAPGRHLWTAAGFAWGGANVAALAVGLFPQLIAARQMQDLSAPPPALRALAVGQVAFLLLIYPLILARRAGARHMATDWLAVPLEASIWLSVALPMLAVAGYLADATVRDVVRTGLLVMSAFVVGWGLAALARSPAGVSWSVLIAVLLALGGPAANYVMAEFGATDAPAWLWRGCPVTFAWSVAAVRQQCWLPAPLWAWLVWPGAAVAAICGSRIRHWRQLSRKRHGAIGGN